MFRKFVLDLDSNMFDVLSNNINFEDTGKGRKGAVLVNDNNDLVPIVRTTTNYNHPVQRFLPIHYDLMDKAKGKAKEDLKFNNAMVEIYDSTYHKMRFHTDQSLDLEENSYICIYSCYENGSNNSSDIRKLIIKNKTTQKLSEILMENNSIVLFSTSTNQEHLHKIILESNDKGSETSKNRWLGLTFRLSKTFIKFIDQKPYLDFEENKILRIATNSEKGEFLRCKGKENSSTDERV